MTDRSVSTPHRFDPAPTGSALATLAFAVLFVAAQFLHPDPFATAMPTTGADFAARIDGATLMHVAHLLEFVCAPLLLVLALHFHHRLAPALPRLALLALLMAGVGSFMLAANKAAFCLTASAFDTLDSATLASLAPGFEVMLHRQGLMVVLWGISLLPLGFVLFGWGLWRTRLLRRWQAAALAVGSLLLANPEVQAITTIAAIILAFGLVPHGVQLLADLMRPRAKSLSA